MNEPSNIKLLSEAIEKARDAEKYHEEQAIKFREEWYSLYRQRQSECLHRYADGTSAWRHNYAYSNCVICGYSDL